MTQLNCTENTTYSQCFDLTKRKMLEEWLKKRVSKAEIARRFNISRTALYKEIRIGTTTLYHHHTVQDPFYNAVFSDEAHRELRKNRGLGPKITTKIQKFIQDRILNHFSPEVIVRELYSKYNYKLCFKTIYNYFKSGVIYLPVKGKHIYRFKGRHSKKGRKRSHNKPPGSYSIEERDECINNRTEFGHYEIDTVISQRKGSAKRLLTFVERVTRKGFIMLVENGNMNTINREIKRLMKRHGLLVKSITSDNGSEFKALVQISKKIPIYFAHPYCSSERGSNENFNRMIRRWIPKKSSFRNLTQDSVDVIEQLINNYPRKLLEWRTANDKFNELSSRK